MADVARRLRVTGQVQGVFFRDSCRAEAETLGVRGWVANEPDGSVSGHFEGTEEAVDALVAWCRTGPSRAEVHQVEVQEIDPEGVAGFEPR